MGTQIHFGVVCESMTDQKRIILKPIGYVRTKAVGDEVKDKTRTSQIVIDGRFSEAIEGMDGFSHIFVLFWLNQVSGQPKILKVHPRGREDLPLLGVFATRTKLRPNPIGLTLVELLEVKGNALFVRGLDAFDETPVLDLKPFDFWDMAENARVPEWWTKLKHEKLGH
jgi:tRNA-Thr(GGU) m(6)t(6)A37 methyltransferase TsaA